MEQDTQTNPEAIDFLSGVQPQGNPNALTTDYINSYTPADLPPEQMDLFNQSQQPATGNLGVSAYYPNANNNIGVGNYSGNEIGSTTLFAPGGALVPIGMMDARDLAIQKAAMQKQKQIQDFKDKNKAPSTKHVAVQKNLTENYYGGLEKWNQNALQKAGGNQALANKVLENDPNFQNWNKTMQDTAKFHDQIVEQSAQLRAAEKDPNFVLSPELRKMESDIISGVSYLDQNPFDKRGRDLGEKFLGMRAQYDLEKSVNEAIDKAIPTTEQLPIEFQGRGKNELMIEMEKKYFTEEAKKEMAHDLYMEKYYGTGVGEDQVRKLIDAKLQPKIERKVQHYDKYFKPDAKETAYDDNAIVSESAENVVSKGQVVNSYTEHFVPTNANDQKKDLKFSISKDMVSADGSPITDKTGYVEGSVQGIGVKPYYKKEGRFLTDEEVKVMKERGTYETTDDLHMLPAVIFNVKGEKIKGDGGEEVETPQKTIYFDTEKLAGVFKSSKKSGKDFEDMRQKTEAYAEEKNKNRTATVVKKEINRSQIAEKAKAAGYSEKEYEALLKEKGIVIK